MQVATILDIFLRGILDRFITNVHVSFKFSIVFYTHNLDEY